MNFLIKYLNGGRDVEYISTDDIFSRFYVPEEIINKYISENSHKSMGVLSEAFVKQPV